MTTTSELSTTVPKGSSADSSVAEAVAFHRLGREALNGRWWRPPLVGVVAVACYVAVFVAVLVTLVAAGIAYPRFGAATDRAFTNLETMDLRDPMSFGLGMGMIVLALPALLVAVRLVGSKPVGLASSVLGRIRWRWLARCGVLGSAVYAVAYLASFVIGAVQGESFSATPDASRIVLMLMLTLVLVPLQSAAEEYVFRGHFMQAIGQYLRHPAFAILLPVPLFVFGHDYELLGQIDVAVFAVVAGWLTWRTGGLEAAIALHVVGNVSGLALGAFGLVDVNATDQSLIDLLLSVLFTLAFAAIVVRLAGAHSIQRTRRLVHRGSHTSPELPAPLA